MTVGAAPPMPKAALVAGGGIAGLAAALACARAGYSVQLLERSAQFSEVGAGIQIGPNVTRRLHQWGLQPALQVAAAYPSHLQVRSALDGGTLGKLQLGNDALQRYGTPYATIHRADLHGALFAAVQSGGDVHCALNSAIENFDQTADRVLVHAGQVGAFAADLLVGADGLWSTVRQRLLGDGLPHATGHLAYRALVAQSSLPVAQRSQHITVWLGPDLHVVQYPVRAGDYLNVVAIVHGVAEAAAPGAAPSAATWDELADATALRAALSGTCTPLRDLVTAIAQWRKWVLCDRAPMAGPREHAQGRVVLLGDAAHPMRPYLAQGAGMAIEDAYALGDALAGADGDVPAALQHLAETRWRRNARVQRRAIRNGQVFHARGLVRIGRDLSLKMLGARLLDMPWLYRA